MHSPKFISCIRRRIISIIAIFGLSKGPLRAYNSIVLNQLRITRVTTVTRRMTTSISLTLMVVMLGVVLGVVIGLILPPPYRLCGHSHDQLLLRAFQSGGLVKTSNCSSSFFCL